MALLAQLNEKIDVANEYLSRQVEKAADAVTGKLTEKARKLAPGPVRSTAFVANYLTALGSRTAANAAGDALTAMLNHAEGYHALRAALRDMRGMTESNAPLMRMVNRVKAQIDALRQDFREGVPAEVARSFSRKLSRAEWQRLHKGLARTDLLALGLEEARSLAADPTRLKTL